MARTATIGQKVGAGFAVTVALAVLISVVAVYALRTVVASKDRVIAVNAQNLVDAEKLEVAAERTSNQTRGFLLTREQRFVEGRRTAITEFGALVDRLRRQSYTEEGRHQIDAIERTGAEYNTAAERVIEFRRSSAAIEAVTHTFDDEVLPRRDALDQALNAFIAREDRLLEDERRGSSERAATAVNLVVAMALVALALATALALVLTRTLSRQIGAAVQHVQSSSAELQATANQQATGAREQATAMTEISTTISELLATSRQIAESAQRVAHVAEETASAARAGDQTVLKAQDSVGGIRRQVDLIVNHMLDLGRKSQQIGGILEIINELADQTNILAINATIEAAGAGDSGKRFAVVADEIRKLADRVGGSTKEIRALIDEIRAAVNTTVMATEGGSKAVDAGTQQFVDVAASFRQIAELVATTTQASREIELSTKQQTSAVEQVNGAMSSVAQATREAEASTRQTVETASQLNRLSGDLTRLIQSQASA